MTDSSIPLESFFDKGEQLCRTSAELLKLKTIRSTAFIFSALASGIPILFFSGLSLVLGSIGAAIYIGEQTGQLACGFGIVSAGYAIVGMILCIFRRSWIQKPLNRLIIKLALK